MIDQVPISETPPSPTIEPPRDGMEVRFQSLETRVGHLEEKVAALQNRVTAAPPPVHSVREAAGVLLEAGRQLLPGAVAAVSPTPRAPVPAAPAPAAPAVSAPLRRRWLLGEIYAELRAIVRMYLDPRFRVSWASRLAPLILIPAILTSWLWLPGTAVLDKLPVVWTLDTLYVKTIDLILAFVLFKVLNRDATRYRSTFADLPPSLR